MPHSSKWKMLSIFAVVAVLAASAKQEAYSKDAANQLDTLKEERVQLKAKIVQEDIVSIRLQELHNVVSDLLSDQQQGVILPAGIFLKDDQIAIELATLEDAEKVKIRVKKFLQPIVSSIKSMNGAEIIELDLIQPDDNSIVLKITQDGISERKFAAVTEAVAVLKRRYSEFGFTSVSVHRNQTDEIEISVPTNSEIEEVKQVAEVRGEFGFHLVDHSMSAVTAEANEPPFGSRVVGAWGDASRENSILIKNRAAFTGQDILDAKVGIEERLNEPVITFRFSKPATVRFCKFSEDHVGHRVAMVMDNVSISAPQIYEPICGGMGQITGNFTAQQAEKLAIWMRTGAMPAKVVFIDD